MNHERSTCAHDTRRKSWQVETRFQLPRHAVVSFQRFVLVSPGVENPVVEGQRAGGPDEKVWAIVSHPCIDSGNVMEMNSSSAGKGAKLSHLLLRLFIVNEEIDDLVRREGGNHLEIDLL